jgi:Protein of unknown function (DUF3617)
MRILRLIGVTAAVVPFAALAADAEQLTAGRWEEVSTITSIKAGGKSVPLDGISGNPGTKIRCLSPEEALDPAKYFLKPDKARHCEPGGAVSGGKITLIGSCDDAKMGQLAVTGSGTYEPKSYKVTLNMLGSVKGAPLFIDMTVTGRYVGVCSDAEQG